MKKLFILIFVLVGANCLADDFTVASEGGSGVVVTAVSSTPVVHVAVVPTYMANA